MFPMKKYIYLVLDHLVVAVAGTRPTAHHGTAEGSSGGSGGTGRPHRTGHAKGRGHRLVGHCIDISGLIPGVCNRCRARITHSCFCALLSISLRTLGNPGSTKERVNNIPRAGKGFDLENSLEKVSTEHRYLVPSRYIAGETIVFLRACFPVSASEATETEEQEY